MDPTRLLGTSLLAAFAACGGTPPPSPALTAPPATITTPPAAAPTVVERMVDVGDVQLFVRTLGSLGTRATIVALHGGPSVTHEYMRALEVLGADDMRVVTYNQRGLGRSTLPKDPAALTFEHQAGDLERLRISLGTDKIDIISHSYGGPLAMAYATMYPQHVRSLVFVGSMPPKFNDYNAGIWYFTEAESALQQAGVIPDPLPPVEGDDCSNQLTAELPVCFHDKNHPMTKHLAGSRCQQDIGNRTRAANKWYDFTDALAAVTVPTLIVQGEADPFRRQMADAIVAAMRGAKPQLVVLEKCGHIPFEECPDRFYPIVREFLAARP
jgi:proline iminopeptidase